MDRYWTLAEFGSSGATKSHHYPFWQLATDDRDMPWDLNGPRELRHHRQRLLAPQLVDMRPAPPFLAWSRKNVFKAPERKMNAEAPRGLYTPRSTLKSLNMLAGSGRARRQMIVIGRLPLADSNSTGPHARYTSPFRTRTKSWNCQPSWPPLR